VTTPDELKEHIDGWEKDEASIMAQKVEMAKKANSMQ
jgi:hypothetical protein